MKNYSVLLLSLKNKSLWERGDSPRKLLATRECGVAFRCPAKAGTKTKTPYSYLWAREDLNLHSASGTRP